MKTQKWVLRRKIIDFIAQNVSKENKELQSAGIYKKLCLLPEYQNAKSISIYLSKEEGEVDTSLIVDDLLNRKICSVFVPRCNGSIMEMLKLESKDDLMSLKKNKWGIREPDFEKPRINCMDDGIELDLILIPGLAFSRENKTRLGYGKGYYDNFITRYEKKKKTIPPFIVALALEEQIIPNVPEEEHDRKPDLIITRSNIY